MSCVCVFFAGWYRTVYHQTNPFVSPVDVTADAVDTDAR